MKKRSMTSLVEASLARLEGKPSHNITESVSTAKRSAETISLVEFYGDGECAKTMSGAVDPAVEPSKDSYEQKQLDMAPERIKAIKKGRLFAASYIKSVYEDMKKEYPTLSQLKLLAKVKSAVTRTSMYDAFRRFAEDDMDLIDPGEIGIYERQVHDALNSLIETAKTL